MTVHFYRKVADSITLINAEKIEPKIQENRIVGALGIKLIFICIRNKILLLLIRRRIKSLLITMLLLQVMLLKSGINNIMLERNK